MFRAAPHHATSAGGIVASQNHLASQAGASVLHDGGNAMDAAVATAFALGAVEPWMSGVGGVGYMIVRVPGDSPVIVDFSARSPAALDVADYPIVGGVGDGLFPWPTVLENRNTVGPLSVCAPTMCMGMSLGWETFGTKPWAGLLQPANKLAQDGLAIDWHTQLFVSSAAGDLAANPTAASVFLDERGHAKTTGWTSATVRKVQLGKLGETLRTIASDGADSVRDGAVAQAIVSDLRELGGKLSIDDFNACAPSIRPALETTLPRGRVWGTDRLTGGTSLAAIMEELKLGGFPDKVGPDLYSEVAKAGIKVLGERVEGLGDNGADASRPSCTSSFTVIDRHGMAVSATLTLVATFGAKVMSPSTGVLLNNAVAWFDPEMDKPNSIAADKACLSNMCPVLVENDCDTLMCVAAAGGRKIVPAVAQVAAFVCGCGLQLKEALALPRLHFGHDKGIVADKRLSSGTIGRLGDMGDVVTVATTVFPYHFAIVTASETNGAATAGYADPCYAPSGVTAA